MCPLVMMHHQHTCVPESTIHPVMRTPIQPVPASAVSLPPSLTAPHIPPLLTLSPHTHRLCLHSPPPTTHTHTHSFRPEASPWRVQFYRCGYQAVSGWPGWRAVVTSAGGDRAWVDLPTPGAEAFLRDYATAGVLKHRVKASTIVCLLCVSVWPSVSVTVSVSLCLCVSVGNASCHGQCIACCDTKHCKQLTHI
jgi:hypothetical protein